MSCFLYLAFEEFALTRHSESCDSSEEDRLCPREAYYGAYVYDIGDDRVDDASEMLREWKNAKRMGKDTIAPDRFNAGYGKGYKEWLKKDRKKYLISDSA